MPRFRGSFRRPIRHLVSWGLLALSCGLLGCGGAGREPDKPRGGVKVTITFGGQPVTEGRVDLNHKTSGEGGGGELDASGAVQIDGIVQGEYTVTVVPPPPDPAPVEPGQPARVEKEYSNIPVKFRATGTSPLKAEVKSGTTEFKFDLKE